MAGALQVASLFGVLDLRDNMTGALKTAENGLKEFGSKVSNVGANITRTGAQMALFAAPIALIGKNALDSASSFESAMAEISARTGLVGEDMKAIQDFALQMGADTMFSAQEAADGFLQLLSSGQNAAEAMDTLGIVMDIAAASGEDLGMTADVLTDIMAAFSLGIEDAAMVADALAQAAGASSADIASLGQGFGNVGPVAKNFGLDVVDTAAALAILSENGIKGAEAGTALKSMLLNMTRTTDATVAAWDKLGTSFYDAEGNARPLDDVLADIKSGLEDMPVKEQNELLKDLAGSYGVVALTALLGDVSIADMTQSMENQATASEVAQKRMDTFAGSADALGGSIETLQIKSFTPFMQNVLRPLLDQYITPAINAFATWAGENPKLTSTVIALGAGFVGLTTALLVAGPVITAAGGALGLLASPMFLLAGALALGVAGNMEDITTNIDQMGKAAEEHDIVGFFEGLGGAILDIPEGIAKLIVGDDTIEEGLSAWSGVFESLKIIGSKLLEAIGEGIGDIGTWLVDNFIAPFGIAIIFGDFEPLKAAAASIGTKIIEGVASGIGSIGEWVLNTLINPLLEKLGADEIIASIFEKGKALGMQIFGGLIDALSGLPTAIIDFINDAIPDELNIGKFTKDLGIFGEQSIDFGSIDLPDNPIPGGSRDSGGRGQAGQPYYIGTGAQPEMFVPDSAGTFYPAGNYPGGGGSPIVVQAVLDGQVLFEINTTEALRQNRIM